MRLAIPRDNAVSEDGRSPGDSDINGFPSSDRLVMLVNESRPDGTCDRLQSSRDLENAIMSALFVTTTMDHNAITVQNTDSWGKS